MQALSSRKRLTVIRHFLRGDSYDVIATRTGVSKGAVAGVISDLKAGLIPEVQEPAELADLLRELAVECRKTNITPERAIIGLTVLSRLQDLQIEPAEIDRWATVYRQLGQDESTVQVFVRTALLLEEIREGSGLTLEGLEARVRTLQEELVRLEPKVKSLRQCEKSLRDWQQRERAAGAETTRLEGRRDDLRSEVSQKETREAELSRRVGDLEQRATSAEERLAAAQNGFRRLEELGLSPEGLSGFAQRVDGIAQRHGIQPEALRDRLLSELEKLDESLSLDALIETRRTELSTIEDDIATAKERKAAELSAIRELRQQKARWGKAVQRETACAAKEIAAIAGSARDAANELNRDLRTALADALAEVEKVRDESLGLGRELGQYQGIVESHQWAEVFSALIGGDGGITAAQLRVAGLTMLRAMSDWPKRSDGPGPLPAELAASLDAAIKEIERWRP